MKVRHALLALFSASLAAAAPAATQVKITNYSFTYGSQTGTMHASGSPFDNGGVAIGGFHLTGTNMSNGAAVAFDTFCVDVNNALTMPTTFTVTPLSQLFDAGKAASLTKLVTNFRPNNTLQSAALQLALWEVAFDRAPTDLNSGAFSITGGTSGDARTLANSYLAQLANLKPAAGFEASLLYAPGSQSQIFLSATPEPESWALMLVGFGATGAMVRRRTRQRVAVSFA